MASNAKMILVALVAMLSLSMVGCGQVDNAATDKKAPLRPRNRGNQVESVVRTVVADRLRVKPESLDMAKPVSDELDVVQIVMSLEERFMFEIPDTIIEKHARAKLGEPACKLSPAQLVTIVEESRIRAGKK